MTKVIFDPTIPPLLLQNLVLQNGLDTTEDIADAAWAIAPTDGHIACLVAVLGKAGITEVVVN